MREKAADLQPALPIAPKCERRLHQVADGPAVGADGGVALVRGAVQPRERRLGIERIDLAGGAVHEQEDRVLGTSRQMRLARC